MRRARDTRAKKPIMTQAAIRPGFIRWGFGGGGRAVDVVDGIVGGYVKAGDVEMNVDVVVVEAVFDFLSSRFEALFVGVLVCFLVCSLVGLTVGFSFFFAVFVGLLCLDAAEWSWSSSSEAARSRMS